MAIEDDYTMVSLPNLNSFKITNGEEHIKFYVPILQNLDFSCGTMKT